MVHLFVGSSCAALVLGRVPHYHAAGDVSQKKDSKGIQFDLNHQIDFRKEMADVIRSIPRGEV